MNRCLQIVSISACVQFVILQYGGDRTDLGNRFSCKGHIHSTYHNERTHYIWSPFKSHWRLTISVNLASFKSRFSPPICSMPRTRDVIVPDAVNGVVEVVTRHTRTKRGTIRTTEKVIPVLRPTKETSGESSKSKKKGKKPPNRPEDAEGFGGAIPVMEDTQAYTGDHEYDPPDLAPDSPPQGTVSVGFP